MPINQAPSRRAYKVGVSSTSTRSTPSSPKTISGDFALVHGRRPFADSGSSSSSSESKSEAAIRSSKMANKLTVALLLLFIFAVIGVRWLWLPICIGLESSYVGVTIIEIPSCTSPSICGNFKDVYFDRCRGYSPDRSMGVLKANIDQSDFDQS